jgi:hypothetical protein
MKGQNAGLLDQEEYIDFKLFHAATQIGEPVRIPTNVFEKMIVLGKKSGFEQVEKLADGSEYDVQTKQIETLTKQLGSISLGAEDPEVTRYISELTILLHCCIYGTKSYSFIISGI